MKRLGKLALLGLLALAVFAPVRSLACAACGGGHVDDAMADGMNWAILTLGAMIVAVLGAIVTFFVHVVRKGEALESAAQKNPPQLSKV